MLAQPSAGTPPKGAEWLHEIKWDGVRGVLACDGDSTRLRSRTGNEMSAIYPELAAGAHHLRPGTVIDGEIVTLDADGLPSFELLQRRMNLHRPVADVREAVPATYVVFDLLHDADSLLSHSLEDRLSRLAALDLPAGFVRSATFDDSDATWLFVKEKGIEGVVSKRRSSPYRPGARSPDWVKSVVFRSVRAVVGGFTEGEGGRAGGFGALILGLPVASGLRWIGSVGTGFSDSDVRHIRQALDEMTVADSPFESHPDLPSQVTWVAPALVAVVQHKQWTGAGRLRGPSFKGFTDYPLTDVTWETEGPDAPGG